MRLGTKQINPTRIAICATREGMSGPWQGSIWFTEERSNDPIADRLLIETGFYFGTARAAMTEMERLLAEYFNLPRGK